MLQRVTVVSEITNDASVMSLAVAKSFLRLSNTLEDTLILSQITAVRAMFERITRRSILQRQLMLTLDHIPGRRGDDGLGWWEGSRDGARIAEGGIAVEVCWPPTISIDYITTYDLDNVGSVYDPALYIVDTTDVNQAGRILLNIGSIWPPSLRRHNAFEITFTAGYNVGTVPAEMIEAMKRFMTYIFNGRGDMTDSTLKNSGAYEMIRPFIVAQPMLRKDTNKRYRGM